MAIQPEIETETDICHGCENGIRAYFVTFGGEGEIPEEITVHRLSGKYQGPPSPCLNVDWETCEGCDCRTPPEDMVERRNGGSYCQECYSEHDIGPGDDDYYETDGYERADGYDDYPGDVPFADPGGNSALRAASASNPRNLPCPTCGTENVLTPADVARHYQCDRCSDKAEGKYFGGDY